MSRLSYPSPPFCLRAVLGQLPGHGHRDITRNDAIMTSRSPPPATKRSGFQFTLGSLLVATAWVGLQCVALRTPTEFWARTILLLTILALLTSVLVVIFREQAARAFAVGF